ncbi:related to glutaredoxin [Fusarium torulosum]|uniref:Related to glutaredoxin n=1 Tax=Fusarium torulosum TaxID=33205 RepID=A0AAE8MFD9_9HYPO|nr:related to glutaredoxin [Fusarium torulosum]
MATEVPSKCPPIVRPHATDSFDPALLLERSEEALAAHLKYLVSSAPVMLFMKGTPKCPVCRFSRRIVRLLNDRGVEYEFFNVLTDESVRQGLKEFADWPTYPQLWVGGELVGGLDVVKEELSVNPGFLT